MPPGSWALTAARRQVVMRMPLFDPRSPNRATNVAKVCQNLDYVLTIYPRHAERGGNLMIADRFHQH